MPIPRQESRNVVPMDLRFGPDQDILSDAGFSNMLYQVLNLKPGAALWAAPVCSTWVYMSFGEVVDLFSVKHVSVARKIRLSVVK